tara:strand:- start:223 stop:1944 length:1722 start_codon:yes stop_codon:yes gene_type:complete
MVKNLGKISDLIFQYKKIKSFIFIFFLIVASFLEGLSIAIIFPILEVMVNNNENNLLYKVFPFINNNSDYLLLNIISIISAIFILKSLFLVYLSWWNSGFLEELNYFFRTEVLKRYINNDYLFHLNTKISTLLRNAYNEVGNFIQGIIVLFRLIAEFLIFIIIFSILIFFQPKITLTIIFFFTIFGLLYILILKKKLQNWSKQIVNYSGKMIQSIQQSLESIKFIKIRNSEKKVFEDYNAKVLMFTKYTRYNAFVSEFPKIILELLGIFSILFLIYFLYQENMSNISYLIPSLGLFTAAAFRLLPNISRIIQGTQLIYSYSESIRVINDSLNISEQQNIEVKKKKFIRDIEIKDLVYSYPGTQNKVFDKINLRINKNDFVCIIGESGIGKTTLTDLITGLVEPKSGEVLIDGESLNKIGKKNWQKNIGYVPQNIILFNSTLRENISMNLKQEKVNYDKIYQSLNYSELNSFVKEKDEGLNFIIDEKGKNLSMGQIQRIAIARSLYTDAEILIFDEFTSSLDQETQDKILLSLNNFIGKKTIIMISHNEKVMAKANKIFELKKDEIGKVVLEVK